MKTKGGIVRTRLSVWICAAALGLCFLAPWQAQAQAAPPKQSAPTTTAAPATTTPEAAFVGDGAELGAAAEALPPNAKAPKVKPPKKNKPLTAEGLENWSLGLDLSPYKKGKYNVLVEGYDVAGNVSAYSPVNIYIDPASDLPVVTIINPRPLIRVGGNINMVGTCVDDDGVARVEVSVDGGEYQAAEGGEFWSFFIDTKGLPEGRRSIDVRAVDINGLTGKSVRVSFDLDRAKPLTTVSSLAAGAIVSGEIKIEGSVFDANGVKSLEFSKDGGTSYQPVDLKGGKDRTRLSFSFKMDTKKLPEGPNLFWFRSLDNVGSKGVSSFLVFVDNSVPTIEIVRPTPGQAVKGDFTLIGTVDDSVGVKSLRYIFNGTTKGEIELIRGDPYFVKEFGADEIKGDKLSLVLMAEDMIGNVTSRTLSFTVDRRGDMPVLKVLGPAPGGTLREGEPIWGSISDDDGVSALRWSVDGGPQTEVPCSETFGLVLPAMMAGKHVVSLTPVDSKGLAGDKVVLPINYEGGTTSIVFEKLTGPKSSRPFMGGIEAAVDGGEILEGSVNSPNPLVSLSYSLNGSASKALPIRIEGALYRFRIPIDRLFPYGFSTIAISAKDQAGNPAQAKCLVYVTNYGVAREKPGLRFADIRMPDPDAPSAQAARVDFGPPAEAGGPSFAGDILGAVFGERLSSVRLEPADPLVTVTLDDTGLVRLSPAGFGESRPLKIVGRGESGRQYSAGPFVFVNKADALLDSPIFGGFEIGSARSRAALLPGTALNLAAGTMVYGSVLGANAVTQVELRVNDGAAIRASLVRGAPGKPLSFSAPLPQGLPYDRVRLSFKALDAAGGAGEARCEFYNILPSTLPAADERGIRFEDARIAGEQGEFVLTLTPGEELRGRLNGDAIDRVELRPASSLIEASFEGQILSIKSKAEGALAQTRLIVRTKDGEEYSWGPFTARMYAGAPVMELNSPAEYDWVRGDLKLSGKVSSAAGIAAVLLSVNGEEPRPLAGNTVRPGATEYRIDATLPIVSYADGSLRLDIIARDGAGKESRLSRFLNKDTAAPTITQLVPAPGATVNGTTTVAMEVSDAGRLGKILFRSSLTGQPEEVRGSDLAYKTLDFSRLSWPLPKGGGFVAEDRAGNLAFFSPELNVDKEKDKPVAEIHAPLEMEVIRSDFAISGVAYDDDGLAAAYYRIDSGEWNKLVMEGTSFNLPMSINDIADNEHVVEVKTEDIYGVQGNVVVRRFRVSREEPAALLKEPALSKAQRGLVTLSGTATDANGIKEVELSLDSRVSFNLAQGAETWRYAFDTRVLADGLHPITMKPLDKYDTEGFSASYIYIDNTPPTVRLDLPKDGDVCRGELLVSGRATDNLGLSASRIELAPIGKMTPPVLVIELGRASIAQKKIDLSSVPPGQYTLRLIARDRADNETLASHDIVVEAGGPANYVKLLYPLDGSSMAGRFRVDGRAIVAGGDGLVTLYAGQTELASATADPRGYFSVVVPMESLSDGRLELRAVAKSPTGAAIASPIVALAWTKAGPWVSVESFPAGRYLPYRPYLEGKAGWIEDKPDPSDKAAVERHAKARKGHGLVSVEISLDNGRSFRPASGTDKWRFRMQTQDYPEGGLYIIARSRYKDGSTAYTKTLFFLDKTRPIVHVDSPVRDGRYNGMLKVAGWASDETGLEKVTVSLRKGDKSNYQVPAFVQGLYFDVRALGATLWATGLGLTFFDDNVKLQFSYGNTPEFDLEGRPERFWGHVFSTRLIANIGVLPFGSFLGPDWDFLSASLGLGADFSYFSEGPSGEGLVVSAIFAQLEFPRLRFTSWKYFRTFAFYTEVQVWVVSSDIEGGFVPKFSCGFRIGVF